MSTPFQKVRCSEITKLLKEGKIVSKISKESRTVKGSTSHDFYFEYKDGTPATNKDTVYIAEEAKIMFGPREEKKRMESDYFDTRDSDDCNIVYGSKYSGELGEFTEAIDDTLPALGKEYHAREYKDETIVKVNPLVQRKLGSKKNPVKQEKQDEYLKAADWRTQCYKLKFDKASKKCKSYCNFFQVTKKGSKTTQDVMYIDATNVHEKIARNCVTNVVFKMNRVTVIENNGVANIYISADLKMMIVKPYVQSMDPSDFFSESAMANLAIEDAQSGESKEEEDNSGDEPEAGTTSVDYSNQTINMDDDE